MADDYLWDRTGPVDPEIQALERALTSLRMTQPLRAPVQPTLGPRLRPARRTDTLGTIGAALLTAAATGALIWAWVRGTEPREAMEIIEPRTAIVIDAPAQEDRPLSVGAPATIAMPPTVVEPPTTPSPAAAPTKIAMPPTVVEPPRARSTPPPADPLPATLTIPQVRDAIARVKEPARACGRAHGAAPGEKLVVQLSIAGSTGRVTSSTIVGEHRGTPLGDCVADAFARAVFPRFTKPSLGVQYPIKMPG